jgi:hypothetical protein
MRTSGIFAPNLGEENPGDYGEGNPHNICRLLEPFPRVETGLSAAGPWREYSLELLAY